MANVEITGEVIKSAIARRIIEAVPGAAGRVYKEPQNQNITGDAFYITQRRISQSQQVFGLLSRRYEMIVRYEPEEAAARKLEKCDEVGNLLLFGLRSIDSGNGVLIHGSDMSHEVIDGTALIYVTYPIRVKAEPESMNPMNEITINKEV
jgi:hypothetical protein